MPNEIIIADRVSRVNSFACYAVLVSEAANSREAAALHEAAHSVIATMFDFPVRRADIIPRDGLVGSCDLDATSGPNGTVSLAGLPRSLCFLAYSFAGYAAELIDGTASEDHMPASDADAIRPLVEALARHTGRAPKEIFYMYLELTIELLAAPRVWEAVREVAALLLERDVIDGAEVRRIVRDAGITVFSAREQIGFALALAARR
jgi:hypothetical protein